MKSLSVASIALSLIMTISCKDSAPNETSSDRVSQSNPNVPVFMPPNPNLGSPNFEQPTEKPIERPVQRPVQRPIQMPVQRPIQMPGGHFNPGLGNPNNPQGNYACFSPSRDKLIYMRNCPQVDRSAAFEYRVISSSSTNLYIDRTYHCAVSLSANQRIYFCGDDKNSIYRDFLIRGNRI